MEKQYDVIIVGAGVAGISAAKTLINSGLKVLLIEKNQVGGKTIHGGGAFINHVFQSIKLLHRIENKDSWSIKGKEKSLRIDVHELFQKYNANKEKVVERYNRKIKKSDLDYISGVAHLVDEHHVAVSGQIFATRYIILAHGAKLRTPRFEGLSNAIKSKFVIESTKIHTDTRKIKHVAILGEGRIAFETVEMFARLGVKVTFICKNKYVLNRIDPTVKELILENIKDLKVDVLEYEDVFFEENAIHVSFNNKTRVIKPDYCVLAMGYVTDERVLGKTNITFGKEGIITNDYCQTNIDNIYAIGDANDKLKLSNVAIKEGEVAANHILGKHSGLNYSLFVSGLMGVYEYSSVGLTEQEIKEKRIPYYEYDLKVDEADDFNFTKAPLVKLFISKITHEILGIHLYGENGSEQMTQLLSILHQIKSYSTLNITIQSRLQKIKDELDDIRNTLVKDLLDNSLKFVYQAVLDNKTRQIIGYESLSRFYIDGKIEMPLPIITMLEDTGKISQLDFKSIEHAGIAFNKLKAKGVDVTNILFYINISSNTIISEQPHKFLEAAQKNNCPISNIVLEVTERQVLNNPRIISTLTKLKEYGFQIALDDFSVGHASLSVLSNFRFDKVKLDRDLLPHDENDIVRIKSYSNLANFLRIFEMKIVAEGIETEFQANYIKDIPVERLQGYYFHKPEEI